MSTFVLPSAGWPNNIRGDQLVAEILVATGIDIGDSYSARPPDAVEIPGVEAQAGAVQAVVDAHVPDPLWAATPEEATANAESRAVIVDLDAWETKARSVWNEQSTFTAAQREKILAALVLRAIRNR